MWKGDLPLYQKKKDCMKEKVEGFVLAARKIPVLDVRSPGEYQKGHIPGAKSFPLFTNSERAEIGTMYKQVGQQPAFQRGLELVGPKIKGMVVEAQTLAKDGKILVHCWRGGMRSESVAQLLTMSGLEVRVLEGGYKAFRNWALKQIALPRAYRIIGGMTGSNKTGVLHTLAEMGEAVADLEGLADHKGSTFGALSDRPRVTQAQFENDLAITLHALPGKHIWLEDESRKIGSITMPIGLWEQMETAPFFYLDVPRHRRIRHLVEGYGDHEKTSLAAAIQRISSRLGGLRTRQALEMLEAGQAPELAELLLQYYDKAYGNTMQDRKSKFRREITVNEQSTAEIARQLIASAATLDDEGT